MITRRAVNRAIVSSLRFVEFKIIHIDDSPSRIAGGVALGLFVAWTPFLGFQIVMSLALASLLRVNKFVACSLVWISNAFTLIPIYYPNFLLGHWVINLFRSADGHDPESIMKQFSDLLAVSNIFSVGYWKQFAQFFLNIGIELTIGGVIIGGVIAILGYFGSLKLVNWYRIHKTHRIKRRQRKMKNKQGR